MKQPASVVLFKHLASLGLFTEPSDNKDWPCFVSFMPDEGKNDVVCLYDTQPFDEGRNHRTGEPVEKPALQIKIRASDYMKGWEKANAIHEALNDVLRLRYDCGNYVYDVQAVNGQSVVPIGIEPNTKRRHVFVINCMVSIIEDDVTAAVNAFHTLVHTTMPTNMALLP